MPTFDCDKMGYALDGRQLVMVNFANGARSSIGYIGTDGGFINAIGFNKLDNYIYAVITDPLLDILLGSLLGGQPGSWLMRVAKNGNWDVLPYRIDSTSITLGDIDDVGRFWVSEGGRKYFQIDVNPASPTFGSTITSGLSNMGILSGVGDWAFVPGSGNYLYSVQFSLLFTGILSTNVIKFNLDTMKWELHKTWGILSVLGGGLIWDIVWGTSDGMLYAQETVLGTTWRFNIRSPNTNPVALPKGGTLLALTGDGARCIGAAS
jgi:hypothetical protein